MDTIDRLFAFGKEINNSRADYEKFCEILKNTSEEHFPITEGMDVQQKKVVIANRAKVLLQEEIINYDYGMEIINLITRCGEAELDELSCFQS